MNPEQYIWLVAPPVLLELHMPRLEDGGAGQLLAHIGRSWDHRDAIRQTIRSKLPGLTLARDVDVRAVQAELRRQGANLRD